MSDYTFEANYWGDCCNTFDEDQKHYVYAQYMGLHTVGYSFSMSGKSVVEIDCLVIRGEDFIGNDKFDEAWIYNCLQHTDDPELIIQNAKRAAKIVRIFEWVDIPPHEGHPIELTKENLDQWLGKEGSTTQLARSGCYGKAYYNIV